MWTPRWISLGLCLALVGAELGVRAATGRPWSPATVTSRRFGWRILPRQTVTGPRGVEVRINRLGYRDRDWQVERRADVRIAVLGKSITFGTYVQESESWPRRLEGMLHLCEVQNFAVAGYRLEQMARVLDVHVHEFEPDLVVLPLTSDVLWPMAEAQVDDPRFLERGVRRTALHELHDRELRAFWPADGLWPPGARPEEAVLRRRGGALTNVPGKGDVTAPGADGLWEGAEQCIVDMRERVASWGGELVLVVLPVVEELARTDEPETARRWMVMAWRNELPFHDPHDLFAIAAQSLFEEVRERGLDPARMSMSAWRGLEDADLRHAPWSPFLFHSPSHYSPIGHELLATDLAGFLRRRFPERVR